MTAWTLIFRPFSGREILIITGQKWINALGWYNAYYKEGDNYRGRFVLRNS